MPADTLAFAHVADARASAAGVAPKVVAATMTAPVWVCLWVSTPMTTSTTSASMVTAFFSLPGTDVWFRSGWSSAGL